MGFSQSSLAVKGRNADEILPALGLRPTGRLEELPKSKFTSTMLPSGWFLVIINRAEHSVIGGNIVSNISQDCEACSVEEHVMAGKSTFWRNGKCVWRISHLGDEVIENLETEGELPHSFSQIHDRNVARQSNNSEVDYYFGIPIETAISFTGYRHDALTAGLDKPAFSVLEKQKTAEQPKPIQKEADTSKKGFWRHFFGGK